jgi:hypothetical protein
MHSSSSTRASRSRISSPLTQVANGSSETRKDALKDTQRTLDQWLEPPVRVKASYQDAGLMRHGVVEHMAPLGTLPKLGHFKSAVPSPISGSETPAVQTPPPKTRIVVKGRPNGKASASRGTAHQTLQAQAEAETPPQPQEESPSHQTQAQAQSQGQGQEKAHAQAQVQAQAKALPQQADSATPPAATTPTPAPQADEDEDETEEEEAYDEDDDDDNDGRHALLHGRRSLASSADLDEEWGQGRSSSYKGELYGRLSGASAGRSGSFAGSYQEAASPAPSNKEKMDRLVDDAVSTALAHFRYPTAWALRTLYDENTHNHDFLVTLEKVVLQTANSDTVRHFARMLHERKREGKKGNKGCYYFVPPATNTHFEPHRPLPAPHRNLLKLDIADLQVGYRASSARAHAHARESGSGSEAVTEAPTEIAVPLKAEEPEHQGEVLSPPHQATTEAAEGPVEHGQVQETDQGSEPEKGLLPQSESAEPEAVPEPEQARRHQRKRPTRRTRAQLLMQTQRQRPRKWRLHLQHLHLHLHPLLLLPLPQRKSVSWTSPRPIAHVSRNADQDATTAILPPKWPRMALSSTASPRRRTLLHGGKREPTRCRVPRRSRARVP